MKSTGIVRKVDELGRIVLPIELRRTLDIVEKDALEIYVDGSSIILKKYQPSCIFCGDAKDIIHYKDKNICSACLQQLQEPSGGGLFQIGGLASAQGRLLRIVRWVGLEILPFYRPRQNRGQGPMV